MNNSRIIYIEPAPDYPSQFADIEIYAFEDDWSSALTDASLVLIGAVGNARGQILRSVLDARKDFLLVGIEHDSPEQLAHLAKNAKKRHCKCGWLGSWRFIQSVAKLKEMLSTNIICDFNEISLSAANQDTLTSPAANDIVNWLCHRSIAKKLLIDEQMPRNQLSINVSGSKVKACAIFAIDHYCISDSSLTFTKNNGQILKQLQFKENVNSEFAYVRSVIHKGNPWLMLPNL